MRIQPTRCAGTQTYCGPPELISGFQGLQETILTLGTHVYGSLPLTFHLSKYDLDYTCDMVDRTIEKNIALYYLSRAATCVLKRQPALSNFVVPYTAIPCIVAQYLHYYYYWDKPARICSIGIKFRLPDQGYHMIYYTKIRTTTQIGKTCQHTKTDSEHLSSNVHTFNPAYCTISVQMEIAKYPMTLLYNEFPAIFNDIFT